MKIIIIGSGVAGLTFANACEKYGFQVTLYEKTSTLKNIGGGILLWPHGIRYLKWLGLYSAVEPFFKPIQESNIIDHLGQNIFHEDMSEFLNILGGTILPIERDTLQQSLLKKLSPRTLVLGKSCISVTERNNKAIARFSDGTQDEADLIVGADGIHSVVRKCLLGEHSPSYTNLCWWGGIIKKQNIPQFETHKQFVILGEKKTFIAWPTYNDKWLWYIIAKMPAENIIKTANGLDQLHSLCQNWNKDVMQVIAAPQEKNFQLGVYTHLPINVWSSKRVTLMGDAVHAMGPILAQGASLAIEDAYTLIKLLQHKNDITESLQEYENIRRSTHHRIYELEHQCSKVMVANSLHDLENLQELFSYATLPMMYKALIPFVDKKACLRLKSQTEKVEEVF